MSYNPKGFLSQKTLFLCLAVSRCECAKIFAKFVQFPTRLYIHNLQGQVLLFATTQ